MREQKTSTTIMLSLVMACLIFYFDSLMPPDVTSGALYIPLILLGMWFPGKQYTYVLAAISTTLVSAGNITSLSDGPFWLVCTNLFLDIFVIWVTAFLITGRKQTLNKKMKQEKLFEHHIARMSMAAIIWDDNFCVSQWNLAAEKIFGYTFEEARGRHANDFILADTGKPNRQNIWLELNKHNGGWRNSHKNISKNGMIVYCDWYNTQLTDASNQFSGVASFIIDRTKHLNAENLIRIERNQKQAYFDTAQIMLISLDNNGKITLINRKACNILGYDESELLGKNWFETCLPESTHTEIKAVFKRIISEEIEGVEEYENEVITKNKQQRTLHFFNSYTRGEDGAIIGTFCSAYDVTDRNKVHRELLCAKENADNANKFKSRIITHISHELLTPLNDIICFPQLKDTQELKPVNEDYVHNIHASEQQLLALINKMQDFANIESGKLSVTMGQVALNDLAEECIDLTRPLAEKRQITINNQLSNKATDYVHADYAQLKKVLINLFSNAVKFNHDGGNIVLSAHESSNKKTRITISDSGKGLSKNQLDNLFEPFEEVEPNSAENKNAFGISLVICKKLVALMNGVIGVDSEPGKGSHFWIELHSSEKHPQQVNIESDPNWQEDKNILELKKSILYIDDCLTNIQTVNNIISTYTSFTLLTALTPRIGLELAEIHSPNLIVLDMHSLGLDGYETLKRLQDNDKTKRIPVIAISANTSPSEIKRALEAGFVEHIAKPIHIDSFLQYIYMHSGGQKWQFTMHPSGGI